MEEKIKLDIFLKHVCYVIKNDYLCNAKYKINEI